MSKSELADSFLLKQFHEFYSAIVREKRWLKLQTEGVTPEAEDEVSMEHPIQQRLVTLLEEQAQEAGRQGGEYGAAYYREAQYVMAALADEIFLSMDWDGKDIWMRSLIEYRLFGTNAAGELFYQKLDQHLRERDPAHIEMSAIYHLALSLGFQGKYRGDQDSGGQLNYYRNQLFQILFHKNADLAKHQQHLFSEPYAYTLGHEAGKRIPHIRRWLGVIGIVLCGFLLVSHLIWSHWTTDLKKIADKISDESKQTMKFKRIGQ